MTSHQKAHYFRKLNANYLTASSQIDQNVSNLDKKSVDNCKKAKTVTFHSNENFIGMSLCM